MKILTILILLISFNLIAKTIEESKSDLKDFAESETSDNTKTPNNTNEDNKYFKDNNDNDDDDEDDSDDDDSIAGEVLGEVFSGVLDAIFGGGESSSEKEKPKRKCKGAECFHEETEPVVWQDSVLLYSKDFFAYDNKYKIFYLTASYNAKYYNSQSINNTKTNSSWLNIAKMEMSLFFNLIYLNYESSFNNGNNLFKSEKDIKVNSEKKYSFERFSTKIILSDLLGRVYIGYDEQVFIDNRISLNEKFYISNNYSTRNLLKIDKGDKILSTNLSRELHIGFLFEKHKITKIDFGLFYLRYNRPYSLNDNYIYNSTLNIYGSYLDMIIDYKIFHLKTGFKLAGGNSDFVDLDNDNKIYNTSSNLMYFQFNGDFGLKYNITDFFKFEILAKIEYRGFYFNKPKLSDDLIFTAHTGFTLSF